MKKISNIINVLKKGLIKTRSNLLDKYDMIFTDSSKNKEEILEKIEELLILSDMGPQLASEIIARFEEQKLHQFRNRDYDYFKKQLKHILLEILQVRKKQFIHYSENELTIILIVGVNGTGKTSFAGKLANYLKHTGKKAMLVPADTYRAAAIKQLSLLANQANIDILKASAGADPAAIVFDGIKSAMAKEKNLLIIDTAGRLHTYNNLMKELEKIKKVIAKTAPESPLHTMLVIDSTTGQNGLIQAKQFKKLLEINHLILTKLDGTAKGGIVFPIMKELDVSVSYITFGEKINDLCEFNGEQFIEALFD